MLYIILSIFIIFPVLMGFGGLFQWLFGRLWKGLSSQMISGIIFLMFLWHILAYFIPLNIYLEAVSVFLGFSLFFYYQSYKEFYKIPKKELVLWGVLGLVALLIGSGYPFILDHFGYYVPTIKWLAEYGMVKGISNLDWVLGQMSPWHIFQAGFAHFSDEFLRINVLLLLLFFLYIIEKKIWVMLCFSPILLLFVHSPSPDLAVIIFSLMILNEILEKNEQFGLLFGFSVLVFSIKPTMIWVPILAFFYPIFIFKKGLKFIWLGVFFGLLYIVKNLWVFGYPFFPIRFLSLGLYWEPYDKLFVLSKEVAVLKTFDLQYSMEEISRFSYWEYFKNWLFLDGVKGWMHIGFILSLILLGVFSWVKRNRLIILLFVTVLIKSILVVSFSAQYRFFMEVFFVVFVVVFFRKITQKLALILFFSFSSLVAGVLFFPHILQEKIPSFNLGFYMKSPEWRLFYKPSFYTFNKYDTFQIGNLRFNVPKDYVFGFDVELPVLTAHHLEEFYQLGIFPQKIGENLNDGFYFKKLDEKNKTELKSIIEKLKK